MLILVAFVHLFGISLQFISIYTVLYFSDFFAADFFRQTCLDIIYDVKYFCLISFTGKEVL